MSFRLLSKCADGTALLEGNESKPVEKPVKISFRGKPAGSVQETVGRVEKPLFFARLAGNFPIGAQFD